MAAILLPIVQLAGKSLIAMLMKLATEALFKEVFLMLADMAAKSTKTKYDDRIVNKMQEILDAEDEK